MEKERGILMESNDDNLNSIQPLKIADMILDTTTPPYSCCSYQRNQDLVELENVTYQEDYDPIECDKCSCDIVGAYWKSLPYEEGMEIICQKDYQKLPKEPSKLKELRDQISKYEKLEREAGIKHLHSYQYFAINEAATKVELPKLSLNLPFPGTDDGTVN